MPLSWTELYLKETAESLKSINKSLATIARYMKYDYLNKKKESEDSETSGSDSCDPE